LIDGEGNLIIPEDAEQQLDQELVEEYTFYGDDESKVLSENRQDFNLDSSTIADNLTSVAGKSSAPASTYVSKQCQELTEKLQK
jgi:hypothetical protein